MSNPWYRDPKWGTWIDRSRFITIYVKQNMPGLASVAGEWSVEGKLGTPKHDRIYGDTEHLYTARTKEDAQRWLDDLMATQ